MILKIDKFINIKITLLIIDILIILFVFFNVLKNVSDSNYFMCYQDEVINFNSARSFYETNNLKAVNSISERRSEIGEFNWYGPGYSLIYGTIFKIFGFKSSMFIYFNLFLFFINLLIIYLFNVTNIIKILFATIFLCSYVSFSFVFTYYPESLIITLTLILLMFYSKIDISSTFNKYLLWFVLLVVLFSFIRITFIFFIFSLVVFIKSKKDLYKFLVLISLIFSSAIIFIKLYTAPSFVKGIGLIQNTNFSLDYLVSLFLYVLKNFYHNLIEIFRDESIGLSHSNFSIVQFLILFVLVFYFFIVSYRYKKRFDHIGLYIVVLFAFSSLLMLYVSQVLFLEKQITLLIPVLIFIVVNNNIEIKSILVLSIFFFLPYSLLKSKEFINRRISSKTFFQQNNDYISKINSFKNDILIQKKKQINILTYYHNFDLNLSLYYSILPVSKNKVPFLYTTNICKSSDEDSIKYKLNNFIEIDYLLSDTVVNLQGFTFINTNSVYFLYKKNNY